MRLDAVALAHLGRADPLQLADAAHGLQDRDVVGRELEGVAVGGRDERRAATGALARDGGREEVVRLEARLLAAHDPGRRDERRQQRELVDDLGVELAARLVGREQLVAVGRNEERVPADDDGARLLGLPEAQEHRHEPDQRVGRPAVVTPERARQGVEGAVGERVAVDGEQRPHRSVASSSVILALSRSVAAWAASSSGSSARSSSAIGSPNTTRSACR